MFENDDEYIAKVNAAYWAEEAEIKAGVHPTQVLERIQERLALENVEFCEITFLDWNVEGTHVKVSLDGKEYGIFNYETNKFEDAINRGLI